jgi:hypothetical protein
LPEFARPDYGDALKLAEREEVLVHGDQDRCAGGDGRTENRDILRITANVGPEVSWHDRARHPRQEAAQLTNFAFGKVELIAKFATELFGNEVGNHHFVMCEHVLEELGCWQRNRAVILDVPGMCRTQTIADGPLDRRETLGPLAGSLREHVSHLFKASFERLLA